ncbi:alternative ribosome rescue aminoacyl-tRNA hydrolase ArfB [Larsenimonas salina]|uniref:alternative ribosome rescue aminoacyl-tRNA hydrolase ArfB n=1 Tax=Larsenimonas salina TaxID=1295565 RepID=UPI00207405A3|nr:alternative ribosome rescue aminoacyl-tRNA hydrolase ArfB [Larsenimonas salina]MCM5705713.1 aminoacyl-tRNA hydrolase [Larsenimonas salina]
MPLEVSRNVTIPDHEIELSAIRAQGAGGQNVNKVASAIHLRFDINASSLHPGIKEKLLALRDRRVTQDGVIVIKAQQYRTQEQNRDDALARLKELIRPVLYSDKPRKATRPSKSAKRKRVDSKTKHGARKQLRGKVDY